MDIFQNATLAASQEETTGLEGLGDVRSQDASDDALQLSAGYDDEQARQAMMSLASGDAVLKQEEIGATAEVKLLYQSDRTYCSCCKVWDDQKPGNDHAPGASEEAFKQFAILKRHTRHGRGIWKTDSIIVHSREIRESLKFIFDGYPDVDAYASELCFKPPFLPFVHRWDRLKIACESATQDAARAHLALLIKLLGTETAEAFTTLQQINETGFVAFENLDLIFLTGHIVVNSMKAGPMEAGVLRAVDKIEQSGITMYLLQVETVCWSGEGFGLQLTPWPVFDFKGSKKVSSLQVFPLKGHPDEEIIRERLTRRGRRYEGLNDCHLRLHSGNAMLAAESKDISFVPLHERVVIDTHGYYMLQNKAAPVLSSLDNINFKIQDRVPPHIPHDIRYDDLLAAELFAPLTSQEKNNKQQFQATMTSLQHRVKEMEEQEPEISEHTLSDEECMLATGWIEGFALESKLWCKFQVDNLADIEWNPKALQNLVLGNQEKRLLSALVTAQKRSKEFLFDDFIQGKGKGVIILLSGPAGVGKTMTAESLSEDLQRPLYRLGAGDLGSAVANIEARLKEALIRCAMWNAILLIDEADVLLEARPADSLERNEIISIFLRLLEYYTGVLILTTNRVSSFDRAFESRIDISLHYDHLSLEGRTQVFSNFLKTLPAESVDVEEGEVRELMQQQLNGRQIKSAIKTALILAQSEGGRLSCDHLRLVLDIRAKANHEAGVEI